MFCALKQSPLEKSSGNPPPLYANVQGVSLRFVGIYLALNWFLGKTLYFSCNCCPK